MEEVKTNAGQGLGIAGLIMGIMAIPLAIMGCTSVLGLLLGGAGIILSAIGLSQATKSNGNKGLPTGGLVVSIVGTFIALVWLVFLGQIVKEGGRWWSREGRQIIEQFDEEVGKELEEAFEDLGQDLEQIGEDLEKKLEDLEWEEELENLEWGEEISDEEFENVLGAYESLIEDYAVLVEKANEGDITALAEYARVATKAVALATKITAIGPNLTEEQKEQFGELQKKYEEAFQKTQEESEEE